jgi:hypothetical protein
MSQEKYIGMEVHQATLSVAVMDGNGKLLMECVLETKAATILEFVQGLRGTLSLTFEEGTSAAWLHDLLKPQVSRRVVCDPRRAALLKEGNQSDRIDARTRVARLRTHQLTAADHENTESQVESTGAQLSHGQQRGHAHHEPDPIAVSPLGHSLSGHYGLCSPSSPRVASQNRATRSSGSSPTLVGAARPSATYPPASATRTPAGEPPTPGGEAASTDSLPWADSEDSFEHHKPRWW